MTRTGQKKAGIGDRGNACRATALLKPTDGDYARFGQDDQPVVLVNWFETDSYCRWLSKKYGKGIWIFSLPTEAEWEKAARGPDNFDYALGASVSDQEVSQYNWKKNPTAEVTVIGSQALSGKIYSQPLWTVPHDRKCLRMDRDPQSSL